jgi:hypothetical protein
MYTAFNRNDNMTVSTRRLIDYYSNRKFGPSFVVRPLLPPNEYGSNGRHNTDEHNSHPELTGIAFNDCLLRFSLNRRVSHVAPSVGVGEILVPRRISLNYSAMLSRMDPQKRSVVLLHGTTFSTDEDKAVEDSFLTTVSFRSRDKMVPMDRHLVDPLRCSLLSSAGTCIELGPDGAAPDDNDIFMSPPAFGAWHSYRACSEDEKKECAIDKDNALMRFQKQLKLNVVQVIKDSGLMTKEEEIHEIALRL